MALFSWSLFKALKHLLISAENDGLECDDDDDEEVTIEVLVYNGPTSLL